MQAEPPSVSSTRSTTRTMCSFTTCCTFCSGCRKVRPLTVFLNTASILVMLGYLAVDLIFSDAATSDSIGTIVPNITDILSTDNQKGLQIAFGILTALARCTTLVILFSIGNRFVCKCGYKQAEEEEEQGYAPRKQERKIRGDFTSQKTVEMVTMNNRTSSIKNMAGRATEQTSSPEETTVEVESLHYQPPAIRMHTVALEVSMQEDFSHSMQMRQRQAFGIDRDMSYKHKPTEGFHLPAKRSSAAGGSGGRGELSVGSRRVGTDIPSISVAEAIALGPSNKSSRFVQAYIVEEELSHLQQQIGELKSLLQEAIKGGGVDMKLGGNFHRYSDAKHGKKHARDESRGSLMKKKSAGLM